ncbi:DeoR/GlpR family DNA-binding transcription regulator [Actinomadura alba]|uniref:DeoR/GlpR transcriptional regulator n=1 Tax=Actinomadura alba TaxID=406431 RepID=A0ABR7LQ55_9ACTN|nr:DeoR/GlpR family DNA-binding transcription regulator [Actinomadura alba]MBC6466615.1 DeoR/GlpR transcriptional regulator [Actinomadura alba]
MRSEERRARIRNLLRARPVTVEEMAALFDVSPSTVRRDLAVLSDTGAVVRTYGGALSAAPGEEPVHEREKLALTQKAAIAKVAEGNIRRGDLLLLDAGTTVGALAARLASWNGITVVTNGLTTLAALADSDGVELIALGGAVRHISLGMIGPIAENALRGITADAVFLGADGVVAGRGVCEGTAEQAALKRLMVEQAREIYVLADSTKLGRADSHWWTVLERPWTLITDEDATPDQLAAFQNRPEISVSIAVP